MKTEFTDLFDNQISLPKNRWLHIIKQHPEVKIYRDRLQEVLSNPDLVKRSKQDKDIFLYYRYFQDIYDGKYLLAVAETRHKSILLTCYITDRIKEGDLIWKKNQKKV